MWKKYICKWKKEDEISLSCIIIKFSSNILRNEEKTSEIGVNADVYANKWIKYFLQCNKELIGLSGPIHNLNNSQ